MGISVVNIEMESRPFENKSLSNHPEFSDRIPLRDKKQHSDIASERAIGEAALNRNGHTGAIDMEAGKMEEFPHARQGKDWEEEDLVGPEQGERDGEFLLPPPASGKQQLKAMLRRQWLFKRRGWMQTLTEILSPALMMMLLVLGWSMSDVDHYEAASYADVRLPLLDRIQGVLDNPELYIQECLSTALLKQSTSLGPDKLMALAGLLGYGNSLGSLASQAFNRSAYDKDSVESAMSQLAGGGAEGPPLDPQLSQALVAMVVDCVDLAEVARLLLDGLLNYNGPLPVPSFDVFVTAHKLVQLALGAKVETFTHTNFPHNDLPGSPFLNVSTLSECRQLCIATPKCRAYSFSLTSAKWSGCWVKSRADGGYTSRNFDSGVVNRGSANLYAEQMHQMQAAFGHVLGNLLLLGKISFAPNTTEVADLVEYLAGSNRYFQEFYQGTFPSEEAAIAAAMEDEDMMWAVVVVNQMDLAHGMVDYVIRMNYTTVPRTYRVVHKWFRGLVTEYREYYSSGFLSLQDAINKYALKDKPDLPEAEPYTKEPVWGLPFPTPGYNHNQFYDAVGPLLGLVMCLTTLYPLGMLVKAVVEEKETRARETMFIMGLRPWVWSLSWLLTYLVVFSLASLAVTVLLTVTFLQHSSFSLVFVCLLLFTSSLIPFGFFMSVFFNNAKLAAFVAPFVHFASIMPRYVFFRSSSGQAIPWKSTAALLPPTAFTFGVDLLGQYEGINEGLNWGNVAEDDFSMGRILLLLLTDFFLYAALTWYLDKVLPSEYGAREVPWFLFLRSYWLGDAATPGSAKYQQLQGDEGAAEEGYEEDDNVEAVAPGGPRGAIKIRGLRKVYSGGKVAVAGLSLEVYEGQITALLGHNGAGKSTAISMLTGLLRPSAGDAHIWGRSIRANMTAVRRIIGVCPQQNVLFGRLSVLEHLELYAALKGLPPGSIQDAARAMVARLGLQDKLHTPARALSGGMKRKLQVAIAMIGGSRVVFLDEPTSGMDPHARRAMWELLRSFKVGRAIVLTTHYMDEADLLCDRIAILSEGRLRTCGTSLFLKARYGVGYNLTMTKGKSSWDGAEVQSMIKRHVASAAILSTAGGELAFQLPFSEKHTFAELFGEIEARKEQLGIGGYGVSMTTLEEVFLRLAAEGDVPPIHPVPKPKSLSSLEDSAGSESIVARDDREGEGESELQQVGDHRESDAISGGDPRDPHGQSEAPKDGTNRDGLVGLVAAAVGTTGAEEGTGGERGVAGEEAMSSKLASNIRDMSLSFGQWLGRPSGSEKEGGRLKQREEMRNGVSRGHGGLDAEAGGRGPTKAARSFQRAWREMLRKRVTVARRDIKGLLNSILLPVGVIAFVMLILKLQIDPAGPALRLNLELYRPHPKYHRGVPLSPSSRTLPVAGVPAGQLRALNATYINVTEVPGVSDSVGMSEELLGSLPTSIPRYGALVYNDTVLQSYNFSSLRHLNISSHIAGLPLGVLTGQRGLTHATLNSTDPDATSPFDPNLFNSTGLFPDLINSTNLDPSAVNAPFFAPRPTNVSDPFGPSRVNASSLTPELVGNLAGAGLNVSWVNQTLGSVSRPNPEQAANARGAATAQVAQIEETLRTTPVLQTETGMGLRAELTLMHNTSSDHALPALIQELAQTRLQLALGNSSSRLSLWAHPLPLTQAEAKRIETVLTVLAALFVLIPFCYLAATFAVFVVKERNVKAKHLQLVSGASMYAYWTATYVWDLLNYLAIVVVAMGVFAAYHDRAFVGSFTKAGAVMLLLVLFGMSVIPLSYCYSFAFSNHANAQVAIAGLHFVMGFGTVVASLIMGNLPKTQELNRTLVHIYRLFPPFNFGDGLIKLSTMDLQADFTGQSLNPYKWRFIGRPLCLMALEAVLYFALTLAIDLDLLPTAMLRLQRWASGLLAVLDGGPQGIFPTDDGELLAEDSDVAAERKRVERGLADADAVVLKGLRKVYGGSGRAPPKTAVADLCLGIPPGQCFGFLGVNGAGKTTTLSMLTGDIRPTAGDAFVNRSSVRTELPAVQQQIGYCPQFDPLLDLMTGREHLTMYARLKGVVEEEVRGVVEETIAAVGLSQHADRCAGTYSGGNKRKLSLGIALVGNPAAVFLDEPSSGMDPLARRTMWGIITRAAAARGASVVLTTHSMEECEALCSRVGLMVGGRFQCLGSTQHLKSRFGEGYHLEVRSSGGEEALAQINAFVVTSFPGAVLEEQHLGRARYRLPMKGLSLSKVFGTIEEAGHRLRIEDYSVSQSTLEQVFLAFAKGQAQTRKQEIEAA